MTTAEIESAANRGNIATADFVIGQVLRRQVIPQFLEDVGVTSWRKAYKTITTVAGTQYYDLDANFLKVHEAYRITNGGIDDPPLEYIGEDPRKVALAEANTTRSAPTGYYITIDGASAGAGLWRRMKFQAPPDAVYAIQVVQLTYIPFADDTTSLNLKPYIPEQFHWGLVTGLRKEIFFDRFGQGDPRYDRANADYQEWVGRAQAHRELARRGAYFNSVR